MERRHHHGISPYEQAYGFSRAVRTGNVIHVAGTAPVPAPGDALAVGAHAQMLRCGDIVAEALASLGGTLDDVVRTRMYIVDVDDADDVGRAHRDVFGAAAPAATMVVVAGLLDARWRVEVEVEAIVPA
jgi:enamine deaminase RidA (YjgF/YER057c/UK114 family)